jgi:hypothetical protein
VVAIIIAAVIGFFSDEDSSGYTVALMWPVSIPIILIGIIFYLSVQFVKKLLSLIFDRYLDK